MRLSLRSILYTWFSTAGVEAYAQHLGDLGLVRRLKTRAKTSLSLGVSRASSEVFSRRAAASFSLPAGRSQTRPPARVRSTASRSSSPEMPLCR